MDRIRNDKFREELEIEPIKYSFMFWALGGNR